MTIRTLSKADYEKSRPVGEQKLEFPNHVVRAYVSDKGELHIVAHRKSADGLEQLPLGYLLGSNALIMPVRKD